MTKLNHIKQNWIPSGAELEIFYDQPFVNELKDWPYPNHFFSYFKKGSTKLVVMLQGGIDRTKMQLPIFQRWSWAEEINASILILNDPTLFDNDLVLGWWQGSEEQYAIPSACQFIKVVINKLGYSCKDILFYGSSAGGFSSLMMAGYLKGSMAIVNNPQINLIKYHRGPVQDLWTNKFRGMSNEEVFERYPTRLSVSEWFKSIHYIPKIVYYQNVKDPLHFENHYRPFVQDLYQSGIDPNEFQSILYTHSWGHFPLERVKTVSIINDWVRKLSELDQKIPLKEIPKRFESVNVPISLAKESN